VFKKTRCSRDCTKLLGVWVAFSNNFLICGFAAAAGTLVPSYDVDVTRFFLEGARPSDAPASAVPLSVLVDLTYASVFFDY
jgi:hypothetical protein